LESLALAYREVLERVTATSASSAQAVANRQVSVIHIVGGGTQNTLLNQMTANATGLSVIAGPVEATVIGNALVQLITLSEIGNLEQARQIVAGMGELKRYEPRETAVWDEAYDRYKSLSTDYTDFTD
jgi:sugar (pentulose or hexulose) kinase